MLFDYATLFSFFLQSLILLITAKALGLAHELSALRDSSMQTTEAFSHLNERLVLWTRIISMLIIFFIVSRIVVTISAPIELKGIESVSPELIHYVLVGLFYLIFWSIFLYLLLNQNKIKLEARGSFLHSVFRYLILLIIFDLIINAYLFSDGFLTLFHMESITNMTELPLFSMAGSSPVLFVYILFALTSLLFFVFIIRRSLKIARNYWFAALLLIISIILFWINDLVYITGWNESMALRLDLLHWRYGFLGLIFLSLIGFSIFFNLTSIILLNIRGQVVNPQHAKQTIISFLKLGYATLVCGTLLAVTPKILMIIY